MSNKIQRKDLIEGIGFILMVVGIITLLCAMYELKGLSKDIREYKTLIRK